MASRTKSMTDGRPAALILMFALPLMLGNVFQQLYTVVDTMVVGKALGVTALAHSARRLDELADAWRHSGNYAGIWHPHGVGIRRQSI